MSLMQASQVIGTANVVSNAGTVIISAVNLLLFVMLEVCLACVIDAFLSPRSL